VTIHKSVDVFIATARLDYDFDAMGSALGLRVVKMIT